MKKNHLSLRRKAYALMSFAAGVTLFASCAQDGFDEDERWQSSVTNSTLESPAADKISISASADGSQTIISWPVVPGAGGYLCSFYDVSDPENPEVINGVKDSLIDACTFVAPRVEDTNYKFVVQTAGNAELNNTGASNATAVEFNSFTETYMSIPAGSDIATWFEQNPIPDDAVGKELCFDLEEGAEYTLSKSVDFFNKQVTLRTTNKSNRAKVRLVGAASFRTSTGLTLKYIEFNCAEGTEPLIALSETPDESIKGATGSGDYYNIMKPITINGCLVENVKGTLFYDGKKKYCVGNLLIDNSVIHLNVDAAGTVYDQSIIDAYNGHVNNFTMQNSTVWSTGTGADGLYLVRYNNSGRCDRAGYTADYVNFKNNTLYNISKTGQLCNYGGLQGRKTSNYTVTDNIFVDCSNKTVARRIVAGRLGDAKANFANNTYMFDGKFEESQAENFSTYDPSGTAIEEDPQFKDPANGDFTVGGGAQLSKMTGDPRWLPAN